MISTESALVLAGGGVAGIAWETGFLLGIQDDSPVRIHEDRILAERLRRAGSAVVATDTLRVITSSRLQGRAPHGFAGYLRGLGDALAMPPDAVLGTG